MSPEHQHLRPPSARRCRGMFQLGLKRKFVFSYFRENFAKIYFHFSRKFIFTFRENFLTKITKITKIFAKIFAKFSRKYENWNFSLKGTVARDF